MNHKLTLSLAAIILLLFASLFFFSKTDSPQNKSVNHSDKNSEPEEEAFSGAGKSLDAWSVSRSYPSEKVSSAKFSEGHEIKSRLLPTQSSSRSDWEPLGPQNFAGRILTIAVDPNNPTTLYAGAASGGLWKSIDDGAHWNYVSTNMPVLGVSSIVINPNNSNEIFIGTGEVYGDFDPGDDAPNQGTGQGYTIRYRRGTYGIGILKSSDGGLNWDYSLDWSQASELKGVNVLKMSPFNSDFLYAGTTDGLFLSTNGGTSWENILNLPNVTSIALHPTNEGTMLVGVGVFDSSGRGIYRSENGVDFTIVNLPNFSGKAMLEFSKSDPNIAFASIGNYDETVGLFRSEDAGNNWTLTSDYDYAKYQGWYSHDVAINPQDDSKILVAGINIYKSTDGGQSLIPESDWLLWNLSAFPIEGPEQPAGDFIHADIHDVVYHPTIPNKVYVASDGGVFKSENDGYDFISANTGLQTVQFYQNFSSSMTDQDFAMGGLQDNATTIYRGNLAWERKIGGDGFGTIIDPNDDRNVWGSLYYMRLFYSNDKGHSFISNTGNVPGCSGSNQQCYANFSSPIAFAPSSLNKRIYGASNIVYKIEDGSTRTATNDGIPLDGTNPVNCLAVSSTNENLVFAGIAPLYNPPAKIFKSENGGDEWTEITNGLPDRFPMDIKVDPCNDNIIYVSFGGYDLISHLFKSEDGGATWNSIGEGLPDVPTNAILIDPENTDHIYIGNDNGVFATTDGGGTWINYSTGLPDACLVMSLSFTPINRKLRVATHGNGAYETDFIHELDNYLAKTKNLGEWYVDDFKVDFEDKPNACIFQQCYYTIKDFDGTEWRGNNSRGFVLENFNQTAINSEWNTSSGDWQIQNEALHQANNNNENTQLDISLNQNDSSSFLYHWRMKFEGNGNEKRAGVHIFADDLSKDFRGNSYLINILENYDQVRIFKTNSDGNYTSLLFENVTIPHNEWMDCKVSYEPNIGRISVFIDGKKVAYVVDETPLTTGNGFSFRSGGTKVNFDDITIYKGRECSGSETLEVGTNGDCRFESQTDTSFVCGIQSVGFSILRGWSTPNQSKVKIGEHLISAGGHVKMEDQRALINLNINLDGANSNSTTTDDFGVFESNLFSGKSITIKPEKLDQVKKGVNTFDLILIKKHILHLDEFTSPYQRIAADVDNSGVINVLDLIKIQLLILDFETEFVGNTSWRFIPEDFVFPSIEDWANFPEEILIPQLTQNLNDANFVAVKIGDVNSSIILLQDDNPTDTRSDEFVSLLLQNLPTKVGEEITIPFFAKDFKNLTGYQMTLEFDNSQFEFVSANPNLLAGFPKENFGVKKSDEGKILMNWVSGNALSIEDETELFNLIFKVKKEGEVRNALQITDSELRSEAYDVEDDFLKIKLEFEEIKSNGLSGIISYPNPFKDVINLTIESEFNQNSEIQFFDSSGKVLIAEKIKLTKGENFETFNFSSMNYSGVIFYKIKVERFSESFSSKIIRQQ